MAKVENSNKDGNHDKEKNPSGDFEDDGELSKILVGI